MATVLRGSIGCRLVLTFHAAFLVPALPAYLVPGETAAAATMIAPIDGASGITLAQPFQWTADSAALGYRLEIGSAAGSSDLLDTGTIHVTRRFAYGLPVGRTLFGRLSTLVGEVWEAESFTFTVGSAVVPSDAQLHHAMWITGVLREMLDSGTLAPRATAAPPTIAERGHAACPPAGDTPSDTPRLTCSGYAVALVEGLRQMDVRLPPRIRNTCLYWNQYECHTLVEVMVPETQAFVLLDPTFGLAVRNLDTGHWADTDGVSDALRADQLAALEFVPLGPHGYAYANGYYLDYPLLFLNPASLACCVSAPKEPVLSPLRYLQHVPLPMSVAAGSFILRCPTGSTTGDVLVSGSLVSLECSGDDHLSHGLVASSVGAAQTAAAAEVLSPVWYVFSHDTDGDGLPDAWERSSGLDRFSAAGDEGAAGDPDGDGATNLAEYEAGTSPTAAFERYLAEGATSAFFETELALANPWVSPADAVLRFVRSDGRQLTHNLTLPGSSSQRIVVNDIAGLSQAEFSTAVESNVELLVDRVMSWDRATRYGSHLETAVRGPAARWYLAEGATHSGFNLFYLVFNPGRETAQVQVRYLVPSGPPIVRVYDVPSQRRFNIWVNLVPGLASTDVAGDLSVTSGPGVIVERAMYLSRPGQPFAAGSASSAVGDPQLDWLFAEGATGPYFDTFFLIQNPSSTSTADLLATFWREDGTFESKRYLVAAQSRYSVWVDEELFGGRKALAAGSFATSFQVTNGVPVVVERAMWWPGNVTTWQDVHTSVGANTVARRWGLAAGVAGAGAGESYVLLFNRSAHPGRARVTLLFDDGAMPQSWDFNVMANSRYNVSVNDVFPTARGRRFGAVVESIGTLPLDLVVERSIYSDANGIRWAAGASALATPLP